MTEPQHAKFAPSAAHRWMACPASLKAEQGQPDVQSSYALEGTAAHALAEYCLSEDEDPHQFIGWWYEPGGEITLVPDDGRLIEGECWKIDEEMAEHVASYTAFVHGIPGSKFYEVRVHFTEDGWGTADVIVVGEDEWTVVDLKYGKGVQVYAEGNEQLRCCALGALNDYEDLVGTPDTIRVVIHQPRLDHVSEEVLTVGQVRAWQRKELIPAIKKAGGKRPRFNPGEKQCRFCKARMTCPARAKAFDDYAEAAKVIEPLNMLNTTQIGAALEKAKIVEGYIKDLRAHAFELLQSGGSIPGWKLVEGRKSRSWDDEDLVRASAKRFRGLDIEKHELISPAQLEKMTAKDHPLLVAHCVVSKGKPTMAPEDDKRPALDMALEGFENREKENEK